MDEHSISLTIALIIMVLMSAFFSASETAFSSLSRARLKTMVKEGNKRAKLALKLADNYDELLSAILVGNNVVNISSATVATILFVGIFKNHGATISTVIMTIVVLIFGEITPKSIAKENPEKFALAVAPIYKFLNLILKPINFLLLKLKSGAKKILGTKQTSLSITEDELLTIVDEVEQLNKDESTLIKNAIEFNDVEVIEVLTPRIDVCAIKLGSSIEDIAKQFSQSGYSRLPVYTDSIDTIIGVITQKDFYSKIVGVQNSIDSIIKSIEVIVSTTKISDLLKLFQKTKTHLAVIIDEHGGTTGIVTLEDILEELVGEIWDEHDEAIAQISQNNDGSFTVPTENDLDILFEQFNIDVDTEATTINGWVIENLHKVPANGDTFTSGTLTITVTKTENRRATKINIAPTVEKNL